MRSEVVIYIIFKDGIGDLLSLGIVFRFVEEVFCPAWLMGVKKEKRFDKRLELADLVCDSHAKNTQSLEPIETKD